MTNIDKVMCNICEEKFEIDWDNYWNRSCPECGAYFCGSECCGVELIFLENEE